LTIQRLPAPDLLVDARAELGEGPVWDERTGRVVWVDIEGRAFHETDPATGATKSHTMPRAISLAMPRASGGFIATLEDGFWEVDDDDSTRRMVAVDDDAGRLRFNDGACDPQGRLWAGTMAWDAAAGAGSLYRLEPDLRLTRAVTGVTISNGLAWSPDGATMYYVDTPTLRVDAFDFDGATGTITRRRPAVTIPVGEGRPDGICVDTEGAIWVALWPGWAVRRYLPDGTLDAVMPLPVARVSSCVFGGPSLDTMFITTAWNGAGEEERAAQPHAGSLFVARPGAQGIPRAIFGG
jgi:sugar lactone lactonase YvrE